MRVEQEDCRSLDQALSLEWLETNGRGGFASGTVAGANTRRYHGLLLTARKPPIERFVLVNHLEEWVTVGDESFPISTNLYPGAVHPAGHTYCVAFDTDPWPTWTYRLGGIKVQREIFCPQGRDMVVVRWRASGRSTRPIRLAVRPMLSGRDYHSLHHENASPDPKGQSEPGKVVWTPYEDVPTIHAFHNGTYRHQPDWYRRIQLPVEQERGLDSEEDWWSPGELTFEVDGASVSYAIFASETIDSVRVQDVVDEERNRRSRVIGEVSKGDRLAGALWRAAEAFLSTRDKQQTVIAGYPWFADWGRDTFISLPGICLVTGRYDVAWQVIEAFSYHVSEGMLPNRFPDAGEEPEYNTIDASLWYVHAVDRYLAYTGDQDRVRQIAWPAVKQIVDGYRQGTRYGIGMTEDGLIAGGVPGVQLTWMDAKVGDWVVTPRYGKPVEIQALWIRALTVAERLAKHVGEPEYAERCRTDRARAITSFRARFWYEGGGYLYDVVDGPDGHDASLRPNQLYAVSLCDDVLNQEQIERIVQVVEERLLTPVGLRTLAPEDLRYRPRYEGGVTSRDGAYHQGTVWPFLLGPFVTAWLKVHGTTAAARRQARSFLDGLEHHLSEACLGQVSEIFDAQTPYHARGCPAQAWSVAEPLRVLIEDLEVTATVAGASRSKKKRVQSTGAVTKR